MLLDKLEAALKQQKFIGLTDMFPDKQQEPLDFATFQKSTVALFRRFDTLLFDGKLFAYMKSQNIDFEVQFTNIKVAGMTVFDPFAKKMVVKLNKRAWIGKETAMVGGELCHSASSCLAGVCAHESIHVFLFALYHELGMQVKDIRRIKTFFDLHHNVLFCHLLKSFFGQDTIDNSLLLQSDDAHFIDQLTFDRSVLDIEQDCLSQDDDHKGGLKVYYKGQWHKATFVRGDKPHHSIVDLGHKRIVVPNGLLSC